MAANISPALLNTLSYIIQQQQQQEQGGGGLEAQTDSNVGYVSGICPDEQCQMKLYYPTHEVSVECPGCGQRHNISDIRDRVLLKEKENKIELSIQQMRQAFMGKKTGPELVQVRGISNYQCKLLSPLLTTHGRDGKTDSAKPLTELGMGDTFDCSKFATRAFSIEENQLDTVGYGRDRSGSVRYLTEILWQLRKANDNKTGLVPLHADGDGHCLVHAISRCLVGRELFWHALRHALYTHLTHNKERYQKMFKEFYEEEEWEKIIAEAAPDFQPQKGEVHGLRNIHVFGLANVLRRPIVLLDSLSGIQSSGDYSGLFLPAIYPPSECSSIDTVTGEMCPHSPIVVAWSNPGRNHFVPLVPIRGEPLPKLPPSLCPTVWGVSKDLLRQYVGFDGSGCVEVCGGKLLTDGYMQKLVKCMENLFFQCNGVHLSVVADVHQTVFRRSGYVGINPQLVVETAKTAVDENRLFRCLICNSITCVPSQWLDKGGQLYLKAINTFPKLTDGMMYEFPMDGVIASYSASEDKLCPKEVSCFHCTGVTRHLRANGSIAYMNGDRTMTPAVRSQCGCGYRHYWDGGEYDNLPERIPLSLTWGNRTVQLTVHWFQRESDPERNSNAYDVAQKAINDNFPGEFGSERLVQQIVDSIMHATERRENIEQVTGHHPPTPEDEKSNPFNREEAFKSVMMGPKSQTMHKEELNASNTERRIRARVEENARIQQRKKSAMVERQMETKTNTAGKRSPVNQKAKPRPEPVPSAATPSPSLSHTSSPPASKKIKVTSSDGRMANLNLDPNTTFLELQAAIERELSIPVEQQRLRWGFPPKELRPSDPTHPVELTNGERVSVDVVAGAEGVGNKRGGDKKGSPERGGAVGEREEGDDNKRKEQDMESASKALDHIIQQLQETAGAEFDLWTIAQYQPHFFEKGGDYYQQVVQTYGGEVADNTHLQFREFPNKTFAFNKKKERLELCLGHMHVCVGPITPEQEVLALSASTASAEKRGDGEEAMAASVHDSAPQRMGLSGAVTRSEGPAVKAFSGKGQALGSRPEKDMSDT